MTKASTGEGITISTRIVETMTPNTMLVAKGISICACKSSSPAMVVKDVSSTARNLSRLAFRAASDSLRLYIPPEKENPCNNL